MDCTQLTQKLQQIQTLHGRVDLALKRDAPIDDKNENKGKLTELLSSVEIIRQMREAKEIFGEDFMGPFQVEQALGQKIELSKIPLIPYTREDMETFKKLGYYLIYHADKLQNGETIDTNKLNEICDITLDDQESKGLNEKIEPGWALVMKDPSSVSYTVAQELVQEIAEYIWQNFKAESLPYSIILAYLNSGYDGYLVRKSYFNECKDKKEIVNIIRNLKLLNLVCPTVTEVLYNLNLSYKIKNLEYIKRRTRIFTKTIPTEFPDSYIITVGSGVPNPRYGAQIGLASESPYMDMLTGILLSIKMPSQI